MKRESNLASYQGCRVRDVEQSVVHLVIIIMIIIIRILIVVMMMMLNMMVMMMKECFVVNHIIMIWIVIIMIIIMMVINILMLIMMMRTVCCFRGENLLIMGIMSIKGETVHRNLFITKTFNSADFFSSQKERNFRNFSRFMTRKKFSRIESLGDEKISMIQIEMEIYFVMSNKS